MIDDKEFKLVYNHETFREKEPLGVKILIATDSESTEQLKVAIWKFGEQIFKEVWKSQVQQDEKVKQEAAEERAKILALFGDRVIFVEEIPNGYCGDPCCCLYPWFIITTIIGHIKIGWRKRVINLDWTKTTQTKKAEELFPNENVTKSGNYEDNRYIHAWGYEKAKEYLDIIHG